MIRRLLTAAAAVIVLAYAMTLTAQSVYPTGTTIYDPGRAWNGYTVLSPLATQAVLVIDMNGNVVKRWENFNNSAGGPARVLPGGVVIAASGARPPHQESLELVQRDFAGEVCGSSPGTSKSSRARARRSGPRASTTTGSGRIFPPAITRPSSHPRRRAANPDPEPHQPEPAGGRGRAARRRPAASRCRWLGQDPVEWMASDHVDQLGFSRRPRAAMKAAPLQGGPVRGFDWLHINSATYVGPNRWFDAGDMRFAPNNVIISSREASLMAIVGRDGSIVWRIGPDFSASRELRAIRQIIGQHHAHIIPKGLPGAGNLLVFDNGGSSGYGSPSPIAPEGRGACARDVARAGDQPRDARTGVVVHQRQILQHQHQRRAAAAQRQHADHCRRRRPPVRGDAEGRDRWEDIYPVFPAPMRRIRSTEPTGCRITGSSNHPPHRASRLRRRPSASSRCRDQGARGEPKGAISRRKVPGG